MAPGGTAISGSGIVTITNPYIPPEGVNLVLSTFYFLSGTVFSRQVGAASGAFAYHHPRLSISADFPEDLAKVNLPHLALVEGATGQAEAFSLGSPAMARRTQFTLYGFAGSYKDPGKNKWERTLLLGDCRQLLADARIPIYDFSSGSSVTLTGYGDVTVVSSSIVQPNDVLTAERYKFEVTFEVEY